MASLELATATQSAPSETSLGDDTEQTEAPQRSERSGSDFADIYTDHAKKNGHVFGFSPSLQNTELHNVVKECFRLKFALLHGYLTKSAMAAYWILLILLEFSKFVSIGIAVVALRVLFNNVPGNVKTASFIVWMVMWAFFVCMVISMQGLVRGQIIEAFNLRANTMLTLGRAKDAEADGVPLSQIIDATSKLETDIGNASRLLYSSVEGAVAAIMIALMCVIACIVYSPWLGLTGIILGIVIVLLALFDDYHTYHTIVQDHRLESDPKRKMTTRGEHGKIVKMLENKTHHNKDKLAEHLITKSLHLLGILCAPVAFLWVAGVLIRDGKLDAPEAVLCIFYFCYAMFEAQKCHVHVTHIMERAESARGLIEFATTHGLFEGEPGSYFSSINMREGSEIDSKDETSLMRTKSRKRMSIVRKNEEKGSVFVGIFLLTCAIVLLIVGALLTESGCSKQAVVCLMYPDNGQHVKTTVAQAFSLRSGCAFDSTPKQIVNKCADLLVSAYNEVPEGLDWDDGDDVWAEAQTIAELQQLADASASDQVAVSSLTVAAEYVTYSGYRNRYIRSFAITDYVNDTAYTDGRRLYTDDAAGGDDELSWYDLEYGSESVYSASAEEPATFDFTFSVTVATRSYADSKNTITARLIGSDGSTTDYMTLGVFRDKGETREMVLTSEKGLYDVQTLELTTSGKDGVKFEEITVDVPPYGYDDDSLSSSTFTMSSFLKCAGSKRKGTYSCVQTLTPTAPETDGVVCPSCTNKYTSAPWINYTMGDMLTSGEVVGLTYGTVSNTDGAWFVVYNNCTAGGAQVFEYAAYCDNGCFDRKDSFSKSPTSYFGGDDTYNGGTCQQGSGSSYPKVCVDPLDSDGEAWSLEGYSSSEIKASCDDYLSFDRGHQIPANHYDFDEDLIDETNYMTNILPQIDKMNRGAWLATEMVIECYRDVEPLYIVGGAAFDRNDDMFDYFEASHGVKTPSYQWKVIQATDSNADDYSRIAYWMPNTEEAKASKIDDYVVSIDTLESNLRAYGQDITFNFPAAEKAHTPSSSWSNPSGCDRS